MYWDHENCNHVYQNNLETQNEKNNRLRMKKKERKKRKKITELEIMCYNAIHIYKFWYNKSCCFPVKYADVSGTQGVSHFVFMFFFSLGKV